MIENTRLFSVISAIGILLFLTFFLLPLDSKAAINDNANNSLTSNEIQELKQSGFPEDVIKDFEGSGYTFEEIESMELMGEDEKYYKVVETFPEGFNPNLSEDHMLNLAAKFTDDQFSSTVEEISYEEFVEGSNEPDLDIYDESDFNKTSYKSMTIRVWKVGNDRYSVSNKVHWTKAPSHRKYDLIGVGINENTSPIPNTQYGYVSWTDMNGHDTGRNTFYAGDAGWETSKDYGLSVKLPANRPVGNAPWARITVFMQYEIKPNVSGVKLIDGFGHYAHQEKTTTINPSFDIVAGTISIQPKYETNFTEHPALHVQMNK